MESYPTLLSPIDNFAFPQFTNSSAGGGPASRGKPNSQNMQQDVPRTPLLKPSNEWQELLDGSQAGQYSFGMWDENPFGPNKQASASPWRPNVFRTLSDSFLDSPLSSSSFLSSASGSPSVHPSTTCSPWETCPGLAPASPDIPLFDELSLGLQGSLNFSSEEASTFAMNNAPLSSPLRSPIMLSYEADSNVIGPFNHMETYPATTIEPSHLMPNALGLNISGQDNSNHPMMSSTVSQLLPPFGDSSTSPPHSKMSSPLTNPNDVPLSPSRSVPSHTAGSFEGFPPSAGFPSESSMHDRATRRKTSRVDYAEVVYDGDSDEDLEESVHNDPARFTKRRKAGAESPTFMYSESDDDGELGEFGGRRGKKGGKRSAIKGGATSNAKRKCKRRHHCPLDECKQSFTRVTDMARHLASVHRTLDTDANRCSFCHKAFSRDDAVLRHENDSCPMRPRKKASPAELWA